MPRQALEGGVRAESRSLRHAVCGLWPRIFVERSQRNRIPRAPHSPHCLCYVFALVACQSHHATAIQERVPKLNEANEVISVEGFVTIRTGDQIVAHGLQDGDFVAFRVLCTLSLSLSLYVSFCFPEACLI